MLAVKGNKAYTVSGAEARSYADQGYDVYDDKGLVMRGAGATVPLAEHEKALSRIADLEAQLEGGDKPAEPTRAQLVEQAEALGLAVPSKATKPEILALIAEARGEAE